LGDLVGSVLAALLTLAVGSAGLGNVDHLQEWEKQSVEEFSN
jgi:hypothetical protein